MDPIPAKVRPKTITNVTELEQAVKNQSESQMYWYHLRSDFISDEPKDISYDACTDDEIFNKLKDQIQMLCKNLPHSRLILSIRQIGGKLEVTINPLTCTA